MNELNTSPYKVLLKKGELADTSRDRAIPYKIYYPDPETANQKFPVIIWSHGFGGSRDGAAFLSRYIAGHGYVIIHLTHFGTDSSLWEGKPGHPWDILRKLKIPRSASLNRFYDVPFFLDQLPTFKTLHPEIFEIMDLETLGMSGHSFGAMSTQVAAGMMIPDENGKLIQIKEPRFKAGITYSMVPIAHLSDAPPEELYSPIDLPLQFQTGTDDASPIENFGYEHRLIVPEHASSPVKHLLVKENGDHMVYNGSRGKLDANPLRARHEEIIQRAALAFWDMMLKDDEKAKKWLSNDIKTYLGTNAEYSV